MIVPVVGIIIHLQTKETGTQEADIVS